MTNATMHRCDERCRDPHRDPRECPKERVYYAIHELQTALIFLETALRAFLDKEA